MNRLRVKTAFCAQKFDGINEFFEPKALRRADNIIKLSLYAAARVLTDAKIDLKSEKHDTGLIIATGRGAVKQTCAFMDSIIDDGDALASPLAFSSSVHNAFETAVTMLLNLRGPCLTISSGAHSLQSARVTALSWLLSKRCKNVLLGVADETHPVILKEHKHKHEDLETASFFLLNLDDGEEFIFDETKTDHYNPSHYAAVLAKKYSPFITLKDAQRIAADFIKTSLAGEKKNILDVFQNSGVEEITKDLNAEKKEKIYSALKDVCLAGGADFSNPENIAEKCRQGLQKGIVFLTSGSTGEPKKCVHSKEMIREETDGVLFLFNGIKRVVSTVPAHHSFGFIFTVQMPKSKDIPVIFEPPVPVLEWGKILKEGDLLVTFPLFLKYLDGLDFKFPQGVRILTSTAPCPDALMQKMYSSGAKRVIEIYGSSETGAIGFRDLAGAPFFLLPFWDYAEKDETISEIFRKKTPLRQELPDIVKLKNERMFQVIGRKDFAVQVAGVNVYPSKVERALKKNEFVKDAVVRLGGDRLKAFIALKSGIDKKQAEKSVRAYIQETFSAHETPKHIVFGDELPVTPFGKKSDW